MLYIIAVTQRVTNYWFYQDRSLPHSREARTLARGFFRTYKNKPHSENFEMMKAFRIQTGSCMILKNETRSQYFKDQAVVYQLLRDQNGQ